MGCLAPMAGRFLLALTLQPRRYLSRIEGVESSAKSNFDDYSHLLPHRCSSLEFNPGTRFNEPFVHSEGAPLILIPLGILTPLGTLTPPDTLMSLGTPFRVLRNCLCLLEVEPVLSSWVKVLKISWVSWIPVSFYFNLLSI